MCFSSSAMAPLRGGPGFESPLLPASMIVGLFQVGTERTRAFMRAHGHGEGEGGVGFAQGSSLYLPAHGPIAEPATSAVQRSSNRTPSSAGPCASSVQSPRLLTLAPPPPPPFPPPPPSTSNSSVLPSPPARPSCSTRSSKSRKTGPLDSTAPVPASQQCAPHFHTRRAVAAMRTTSRSRKSKRARSGSRGKGRTRRGSESRTEPGSDDSWEWTTASTSESEVERDPVVPSGRPARVAGA